MPSTLIFPHDHVFLTFSSSFANKSFPTVLFLVLDMGNPRVHFTLPLPISVSTRTHEAWVRILTGFALGTDMGKLPKGKGMDLLIYKYTNIIYN